jgi:FkbM family methyltransferase
MRWLGRRRPEPPAFERRVTDADIRAAYRMLLGREPDPGGLAHFQALAARGLSLDGFWRLIANSEECRARSAADVTEVDLGGYLVCCRSSEPDFGQAIAQTGRYDPHVCAVVTELLKPGDTFVDVGANVGCIALLAAKLVGPGGRVVAVEPNPENVQLLLRGIAANRYRNVRVLPFAASDRAEVVHLVGTGSNTSVDRDQTADATGAFFVQALALDDLLGNLDSVGCIKLDIEGFEPLALKGLARTLERHRPTLIVEFNPRCLRDLHGLEPIEFARQLYERFPRLRALTPFGDDEVFGDPDSLWAHWTRRSREVAAQGLAPEGMLCLDLVAAP